MSEEDTNSVVLVSKDNFQFVMRKSAVLVSPAIKSMLDKRSNFVEARENKIYFPNMSTVILETVCEYFYYKEKYRDAKDVPDMDVPPELALELLMMADFLHI